MRDIKKNIVKFCLNENEYIGTLTLDNDNSILTCWSLKEEQRNLSGFTPTEIKGLILDSFEHVTLLNLLNLGDRSHSKQDSDGQWESMNTHLFFPHHIITGPTSFNLNDTIFDSIQFYIKDLSNVFRSRQLFEYVDFPDTDLLENLIRENIKKTNEILNTTEDSTIKPVKFGESPSVVIHTDLNKICELKTPLGLVSLYYLTDSSNGLHSHSINSRIACNIRFNDKCSFNEAYNKIWPILNLFELIAGQRLKANTIDLFIEHDTQRAKCYNVYSSMYNPNTDKLSYYQELINPNEHPDEFSKLLPYWLDRTNRWTTARGQFFDSFTSNEYSSGRLVKVANMFDIIPDEEYDTNFSLPDELKDAKMKCKEIFSALPRSSERDSILGALGRIGKLTLKNKVKARANIILANTQLSLEDFNLVIDQSIDCRNYFVHGSVKRFDYYEHFDLVHFFIHTLEFIFGVSELTEAGWDFDRWMQGHGGGFHPFKTYLSSYSMNLDRLNAARKQRKPDFIES